MITAPSPWRSRRSLPSLAHVFVVDGSGAEAFEALLALGHDEAGIGALRTRRLSPDAPIQLLYTSGTTGEPKGVLHTSNTMLSNLVPFAERLHLGENDVIHMPSPMAHQLGFMYGLVLPAILGATAVLQDIFVRRGDGEADRDRARHVHDGRHAVPQRSRRLLHRHGDDDPDVANFRFGRRADPAAARRQGAPRPGRRGAVGLGNVGKRSRHHHASRTLRGQVTTTDGCPLPGMEVRVVDPAGVVVPSGEEGRLQVRGCSNFIGYRKRPGLAQIDAEGWFETGDIVRMDADGYIRIAGRAKDIIIRGGENIPVYEVEELLFKHPSVAAVAVVGYPDERLGERACAFVIPRKDASLCAREMVDYLKAQKMAVQYIPERLEIVAELPRTPSGKIQKFKLREIAKTPAGA